MDDYLSHHGILGQKWGVRNGPPYPLAGGGLRAALERRKAAKAEKAEEFTDTFLIAGDVESGVMKNGNVWYKVAVESSDKMKGDLVFYPNQTAKVADRFEKMLRWVSENKGKLIPVPIVYSAGAKGGFIFKDFG